MKTVLENLKHDASKLLYWFKINSMKANPEKFQFMILSKKPYQPQKLSVNTFAIDESDEVELVGLKIDELNFSKHIDKLCRNAQYKRHALRRIRKYLHLEKAQVYSNPKFMCSFFTHKEIPYNLRKDQVLSLPRARSTHYGTNSVHFRESLIFNNLPSYIKFSRSVCEFKNNIKNFRNILIAAV